MLLDRPLVMIDGIDARWLLPVVSGALLEARRAGMNIGDRPLKLLGELEELARRHREAAAAVLAEATTEAKRTSEANFSADVLWSVAEVAKVANVGTRRVQVLAKSGVLEPCASRPYLFEATVVAAWLEGRKESA